MRPAGTVRTFTYTHLPSLDLRLPSYGLRAPDGVTALDGVMPALIRLDISNAQALDEWLRTFSTWVLDDVLSALTDRRENSISTWLLNEAQLAGTDPSIGHRWDRDSTRTIEDVQVVLNLLQQMGLRARITDHVHALDEFLAALVSGVGWLDENQHLPRPDLTVEFNEHGRPVLGLSLRTDPFDRTRLEALAAYTGRGPGLKLCDVCTRPFVPPRSGRPTLRCPGFPCGQAATKAWEHSDTQREYRRIQARGRRARQRGDVGTVQEAERQLDVIRRERRDRRSDA